MSFTCESPVRSAVTFTDKQETQKLIPAYTPFIRVNDPVQQKVLVSMNLNSDLCATNLNCSKLNVVPTYSSNEMLPNDAGGKMPRADSDLHIVDLNLSITKYLNYDATKYGWIWQEAEFKTNFYK